MNTNGIDFVELSTYCQNRYKESVTGTGVKYVKTLFVALYNNGTARTSTTPHILKDADCCLMIHQRDELAVSNWYYWYDVEYINAEGEVRSDSLGDGFTISISANGSYSNQQMSFRDDKFVYLTCKEPWEDSIKKVWSLYTKMRSAKTVSERNLILNLFKKDETILQLERQNEDLSFTKLLLEQEKNQYKELLDRIQSMIGS